MLPSAMVSAVIATPSSAAARATASARRLRRTSTHALATLTTTKAAYAVHALGTWTYIRRCAWPCTTSGGASDEAEEQGQWSEGRGDRAQHASGRRSAN